MKLTARTRAALLEKKIESLFSEVDPYDPDISEQCEEYIVEMFEIVRVIESRAQLKHFFNDKIYSPVIVDPNLACLLRPKHVFLMALGRNDDSWQIKFMSAPYG